MKRVSRENLSRQGEFGRYLKKTETLAVRIESPFEVETREGVLRCEDGFLAVDSAGYPYPIARAEFERIYELVPRHARSPRAEPDGGEEAHRANRGRTTLEEKWRGG